MPKNISIHTNIVLKKDGKVVKRYSGKLKSRILAFSNLLKNRRIDFDSGVCTIIYRSRPLLFNEFKFTDGQMLIEEYNKCTEPALISHITEGAW